MPLSLLNHSALALFAQRTRIPTSARSIGFCAIWVCISSSSAHVDFLADLSYYGDRGSKTAKAIYCLVNFRAWGLMLSCRDLVQASSAPRDLTQHPPVLAVATTKRPLKLLI